MRIAKADLVPTKANLRTGYNSFAELAEACGAFCDKVNGRVHRETVRIPAEALLVEQTRLHPLPAAPFNAALGETRNGVQRAGAHEHADESVDRTSDHRDL